MLGPGCKCRKLQFFIRRVFAKTALSTDAHLELQLRRSATYRTNMTNGRLLHVSLYAIKPDRLIYGQQISAVGRADGENRGSNPANMNCERRRVTVACPIEVTVFRLHRFKLCRWPRPISRLHEMDWLLSSWSMVRGSGSMIFDGSILPYHEFCERNSLLFVSSETEMPLTLRWPPNGNMQSCCTGHWYWYWYLVCS